MDDPTHPEPAYPPTRPQYVSLSNEETQAMWRAMVLAPILDVFHALLRGEDVPRSALDPQWAKRFGL